MDQGVIKCLKAFYRRRLFNFMIKRLEQGQDLSKISILHVLQLLHIVYCKSSYHPYMEIRRMRTVVYAYQNTSDITVV